MIMRNGCFSVLNSLSRPRLRFLKTYKDESIKRFPNRRIDEDSQEVLHSFPPKVQFSVPSFEALVKESMKSFMENYESETKKEDIKEAKINEIVHVEGFTLHNEVDIENFRKKERDELNSRIDKVESEILENDTVLEEKRRSEIEKRAEYLLSISDRFVTFENLNDRIEFILDNPISYCYAIDSKGKKHHGYTQIPGEKMKSLWDGNPHPSCYETFSASKNRR